MTSLSFPIPALSELSTTTLTLGNGLRACKNGDNIKTRVKGVLADGSQFWATTPPGTSGEFFCTDVGVGKLIAGFDQGVIGMTEGEKRRIMIPWEMGYGARGMPPTIPAKSDLIFEVDLVSYQN
eukprot:GHVH01001623.1.p2 GENE.GHVH01001623.1~~GHVH01001623.1.p2  ORF type:complete len:124 (+),score=15.08 GHVH01001623.1:45-416(+)